jgi:hypothetical protein
LGTAGNVSAAEGEVSVVGSRELARMELYFDSKNRLVWPRPKGGPKLEARAFARVGCAFLVKGDNECTPGRFALVFSNKEIADGPPTSSRLRVCGVCGGRAMCRYGHEMCQAERLVNGEGIRASEWRLPISFKEE